jgi:hypothetical protein
MDEVIVVDSFVSEVVKAEMKTLNVPEAEVLDDAKAPSLYTIFTAKEPDQCYRPVEANQAEKDAAAGVEGKAAVDGKFGMATLKTVLEAKLQEYNESNPMMDLVLFDDAMSHITRIARIISNPAGNAMLIGVGGSGKQSLSKLAAFICGYETKQLAVRRSAANNYCCLD